MVIIWNEIETATESSMKPGLSSKIQKYTEMSLISGIFVLSELGVKVHLKYPAARTTYRSGTEFFITKLKPSNE